MDGQIKGMSSHYGYKEKEFRSMLEKSGGMEEMHMDMLVVKVANFLADNAKVNEETKAAEKTEKKSKAKSE
jgi:FKBP-type peptidyl-prolyl cis-trans isomerase (trigger factor)